MMTTTMQTKLETRTFSESTEPCTRYQIGYYELRKTYKPEYEHRYGHKIKGLIPCGKEEPVFRLLGFGSTVELAQRMAAKPTA